MGDTQVVNYIEIEGKEVLFNSLPDDEKKRISEILQERMMAAAGYRRVEH